MILTDYDILQLHNARSISHPEEPNVIGTPIQYFYAFDTVEEKQGGICGFDALLLEVRKDDSLGKDNFYADIAIMTNVSGFYTRVNDLVVTSITLTDENNKSSLGLVRSVDQDVVMETMNGKFRTDAKKVLKLVVNNEKEKS